MVTLKQLRAFSAVAQAASFTRAAERLHLSQSAVSLLVRDLEHQVDARLIERGRQVVLTPMGEAFLRSAVKVLEDVDLALENLQALRSARRRVLRLAVGHLLAATLLPRAVAAFTARRPELDVQIVDCPVEQVAPRVLGGEVDAGIGSIDADPRQPDLQVDLLFRDSIHLASAPALGPLAGSQAGGRGAVPWRRLAGEPLVQANPASRLWTRLHDELAPQRLRLQPRHVVAMYSTGIAMARNGLGRLLAPGFCAREPAMAELHFQPLVRPVVRWDVSVVRRRRAEPLPELEALLEAVRSAAA